MFLLLRTIHALPTITSTKNPYQGLINSFLSGRNKMTIEAYRQDLSDFQAFISADSLTNAVEKLLTSPQDEANYTAIQYRTHLTILGLSPSIINRRLGSLRSLIQAANIHGLTSFSLSVGNLKIDPCRGCTKRRNKAALAEN